MSWWFILLLGGLATYRATILVTKDIGPFRIFERLRKLSPKWLGCPFCFSITAGILVVLGLLCSGIDTKPVVWIFFVLAFSAISIMADRVFTSDYKP